MHNTRRRGYEGGPEEVGAIQLENPHVKRSSSIPFALRWKHENVRIAALVALFTISVTFMFFMLLYGTATKSVALVINGQETVVKTKSWDLEHLLDEQAIAIGEHDRISTHLESKLKHGDRITITTAAPLTVTADGETKTVYTTAQTVGDALKEGNVKLGAEDKITPALDTKLADASAVTIVRVKKETVEEKLPIAFETVKQEDANLLKGKETVVQEGKEGTKVITKERVYENGEMVSENVIGEAVQSDSIKKIVALGTKKPVVALSAPPAQDANAGKVKAAAAQEQSATKEGVPFSYKKMINNVTLTAYSAGPASTGKSAGMPGFGKTFTGTTVTEGRTIAVDPSVVPLGWWVYIEGIGYRRAEDTGSAVKGNKIDVYYDSEAYANKFGLKRGYTVYVIGPKKPTGE